MREGCAHEKSRSILYSWLFVLYFCIYTIYTCTNLFPNLQTNQVCIACLVKGVQWSCATIAMWHQPQETASAMGPRSNSPLTRHLIHVQVDRNYRNIISQMQIAHVQKYRPNEFVFTLISQIIPLSRSGVEKWRFQEWSRGPLAGFCNLGTVLWVIQFPALLQFHTVHVIASVWLLSFLHTFPS